MNYLDASIRGIKFQKNKSQIPKSKNDASIGELNPKRLKLLHESSKKITSNSLSIEMLLLGMFTSSANPITTRIPKWVKIVDEVLLTRWNEPVSLEELSLASQVHPVTISKYFSKYYHRTIGDHITHIRIEKSIPLIKDTKISLGEIAHYCGFADQSHFIRNFKNSTGFLPGEMRKL